MKRTFRYGYACATLAIFFVEVLIALYVRDAFVHPFGGDILAAVIVYVGLRAVTTLRVWAAVLAEIGRAHV